MDEQDLCDETINDVLDNIPDCDETFVEKENYVQSSQRQKPDYIPNTEYLSNTDSQLSIDRLNQKIKVFTKFIINFIMNLRTLILGSSNLTDDISKIVCR